MTERVLQGDEYPEFWGEEGEDPLYREMGSGCLANLIMRSRGTTKMTEPGEDEVTLRETGKDILTDVVTGCA